MNVRMGKNVKNVKNENNDKKRRLILTTHPARERSMLDFVLILQKKRQNKQIINTTRNGPVVIGSTKSVVQMFPAPSVVDGRKKSIKIQSKSSTQWLPYKAVRKDNDKKDIQTTFVRECTLVKTTSFFFA